MRVFVFLPPFSLPNFAALFLVLFVCLIVLAVDVGVLWRFVVVVAKCLLSSSSGVDLSLVSHLLLRFFGCATPESSGLAIQLL